jgi:hypothetical protein
MQFNEILATLPNIDHLVAIELYDGDQLLTRIENKPGSAGSVRVYHHLFLEYGAINVRAAEKGVRIYAEHTADAKVFPGKHPNIDRLLDLLKTSETTSTAWTVKLVTQ